jgi:hypothetical protein
MKGRLVLSVRVHGGPAIRLRRNRDIIDPQGHPERSGPNCEPTILFTSAIAFLSILAFAMFL